MSWAIVHSRASAGIAAPPVNVEVHLSKGLPGFNIVGLPEKVVKESKDRVRSALLNCGFKFPAKKIVVNLAPADLPKEGGRFDLPMAIGILIALKQLPQKAIENVEIAGELELSGRLRSVKGILPFAIATKKKQRSLIFPKNNLKETELLSNLDMYPAEHLLEVVDHLNGDALLAQGTYSLKKFTQQYPDLSDVKGQSFARRSVEIAAAGEHSILLKGPPGAGKTLLASRLPGILPGMTEDEALEVATAYSLSRRGFDQKQWCVRPFRSPHHTASPRALVGGGNPPQPGEITLAHQGVLFLDEFPEFQRQSLEGLREPLEAGKITISRAGCQMELPAKFQLIAAMNPCPCGYASQSDSQCRCTEEQIRKYQSKISGPILDRIDMHVSVMPVSNAFLLQNHDASESSKQVAQRVKKSRDLQIKRFNKTNARLSSAETLNSCYLSASDREFFVNAAEHLKLSARAFHRTLKVARTIADLSECDCVRRSHLEEALCFRSVTV